MDWPKARGILLIALTLVNLMLAYSVWGPRGVFPELSGTPHQQQVQQVRATLQERGFDLTAPLPKTPDPMPFLRVQYRPTLDFLQVQGEVSGRPLFLPSENTVRVLEGVGNHLEPSVDTKTQVITFQPRAMGRAAKEIPLYNANEVQQEVRAYLRSEQLLPRDAQFSGMFLKPDSGIIVVEFVPQFQEFQVFSGFVRAEVSTRGIETVTQFWVQPLGFKEAPAKAVRPAAEALLRLAGQLERPSARRRVITDIRLGYYAGRSLTVPQSGVINAWDTVPVWRIRLETGDTYYINAFNGELES